MTMRKKNYAILFLIVVTLCVTALAFFWAPATVAHAERSNLGTETDDEWSGSQTTGNLITIEGNNGKTLAELGWQDVGSNINPNPVWHEDANLDTEEYGWGIRADNNKDIGNESYEGGVYYRIILSDADRVKADKGDLTVSASALYYWQKFAGNKHYISLKLHFEDADGKEIKDGSDSVRTAVIKSSAYPLNITDLLVPKGTASIRYYVSNYGDLLARPFIGGLTCTLTDKTAPAVSKITVDKSGLKYSSDNVAMAGDTIKYCLELDEKVSVSSFGTAKLGLGGVATSVSGKGSLTTENGKSKICYTFKLSELNGIGALSLYSVNGLTVKDEGGNQLVYSESDISSDSVQYYKKMTVDSKNTTSNNLSFVGATEATYGTDYTATIVANEGYNLPESITLMVGGTIVKEGYSYDSSNGKLVVYGKSIKGDLKVGASGVAIKSILTFDMQGGINGTTEKEVTYNAILRKITVPTREGYSFQGYYEKPNGQGVQYYTFEGRGARNCDFYVATTVYAFWQPNTYTVTYDKNKPTSASGEVTGATNESTHKYGEEKALSENGFKLVGWAFTGWATTKDGEVIYADSGKVISLTADDGATVTLYAVWQPIEYTVSYDRNKPASASGAVTGATKDSTHKYDEKKALSENGYELVGWTFTGWSITKDGSQTVDPKNAVNLTAEAGATVTLYAVWQRNEYKVAYDGNRPSVASGRVTGTTQVSTHKYDEKSALSENGYELIGWTFTGWALSKDGAVVYKDEGQVLNLTAEAGATVTLYAVWRANTYSVTFDADGGSSTEPVSATYDGSLPAIATPARKGYNFNGYYTERNGKGTKYFDADGIATVKYTVTGGISLYAFWTPIKYEIQLYSQGKYVDTIKNVVFGSMRLPSAETLNLKRDNYYFVGWNVFEDQNWAMYSADTDYSTGIASVEGETVVLYASWAEKPIFTINFDANGGVGAPAMAQAHQDETITISSLVPTRKNYTFLGWATESGASSAQYNAGDEFTMGSAVVTFYAVWKLNPSLDYDANGGAFSVPVGREYPVAGSMVTLTNAVPERVGYVFRGWSKDKNATEEEYVSGQEIEMTSEDTILYAVWEKARHAVTVSFGEGYSVVGLEDSYYYGQTATFTVTGNRPKVYVNGQRLTEEDGSYSFVVTGDSHVLIADGSKLSLIYSANGGENAPTDENSYGANSTATVSALKPERAGYSFLGWATTPNAEREEFTADQTVTFAEDDVILYAVWKANSYTVTYNNGGGEGSMPADSFLFGTQGTLSKNAFLRAGHTFIGWALSENGEVVYADGATIIDLCVNDGDNVTLYAVWQRTVTKITFVTENGTEFNSPVFVAYGDTLSSDGLSVPVRTGYLFAGYRTERDGLGELIFDSDLNAVYSGAWNKNVEELTLYSCWIPVSYTVIFVNGQKEAGRLSAVYGQSFNLISASSLGITAKAGYHFAGWSTVPSGQTVSYADGQTITEAISAVDGEQVFLYAVFAENQKFSVVYNANGGTNAPVDNGKYFAGDVIAFPDLIPQRDGYIFCGWSFDTSGKIDFPYSQSGGFEEEGRATMKEGGLTLYAVWILDGKSVKDRIDEISASLSTAITDFKKADTDLSGKIDGLDGRLKDAQTLLDSLNESSATKSELSDEVQKLKDLIDEAKTEFNNKIDEVKTNLTTEVGKLNDTITNNKKDVNERIDGVEKAYADADAVLRSDLTKLTEKNETLTERVGQLETARKEADDELLKMINDVKTNLTTEVGKLNETIANNKKDVNDRIDGVERAYANADAILRSDLAKLTEKNEALTERVGQLETARKNADDELLKMINDVKTNLTTEVGKLNDTIANNKKDVNDRIDGVEQAYANADAILRSDLAKLTEKNETLTERVGQLETARKEADDELLKMINDVKTKLTTEVGKLNDTIANNKKDVNDRIDGVERAYANADAILRSDLAKLTGANETLTERIASLEESSKQAKEAIWAGINQVQKNLDDAKRQLGEKDAELENKIGSLRTENDQSVTACMIAVVVSSAVLALIVGLEFFSVKKRKGNK